MVKGPDQEGVYTFENGAKALRLPSGRYKIIQGAPKEWLDYIRPKKGQNGDKNVSGPDKDGLYTFRNGAKAILLENGQYLIVTGAPEEILSYY